MKPLRFGQPSSEKAGAVGSAGQIRDISSHIAGIGYHRLNDSTLDQRRKMDRETRHKVDTSILMVEPVCTVRKVICVGLNYSHHVAESLVLLVAQRLDLDNLGPTEFSQRMVAVK